MGDIASVMRHLGKLDNRITNNFLNLEGRMRYIAVTKYENIEWTHDSEWHDYDFSVICGAYESMLLVTVKIVNATQAGKSFGIKMKGGTVDDKINIVQTVAAINAFANCLIQTDVNGEISYYSNHASNDVTIYVRGYMRIV